MMVRLSLPIVLLFTSLAAAQAPLPAPSKSPTQSPSQSLAQLPTLTSNTTVVLIPALVTNSNGEPVFTLTAKDFTATDDGIPQKLTLEADSDSEPLALVVAIQTGGAAARHLDRYHNLAPLIEAMAGDVPHKIAVVAFGSTPKLLLDFTPEAMTNAVPLEEAIHGLAPGDPGAAILDALGYAVDLLRTQPPSYRRAILLLSETLDSGSRLKLDDALRVISDTNTSIYSLGFSSTRAEAPRQAAHAFEDDTPGPRGGCMANGKKAGPDDSSPDTAPDASSGSDASADKSNTKRSAGQVAGQAYDCLGVLAPPLALAKTAFIAGRNGLRRNVPETVANLTGGEYYPFKDVRTMERDLMTISNHVPNRYVLSFYPQSPHPGLHALTVKLKEYPHLEISARSSYWADNEAPPGP
jgi:VWFA-related protein